MGANGKGNGKKRGGGGATARPTSGDGKVPNGKAKEPVAVGAEPAEPKKPTPPKEAPQEAAEAEGAPAEPAEAEASEAKEEPETAEKPAPASTPPAAVHDPDAPRGAAWAHPLVRFEQAWTRLESRLVTFVLLWLIVSLVAWVFLNGLCEAVTSVAGTVFRSVLLAIALGLAAWRGTAKQSENRRRDLTLVAIAVGIGVVILWRRAAAAPGAALAFDGWVVDYLGNVKGWLQDGSTLTLLGGLRGLATRLTLWLALLGGSLATASGKHIHVDVVFRFLPRKLRLPVTILNYVFAATVCFAAVWGFVDHIAITSFGSDKGDSAGAKIENTLHHIGNHAFFTRKQIGLDLRSLPHVIKGERYDQWMNAATWNAWLDGAGFEDHFDRDKVQALHIPEGTHSPFVVSPDGETTRSALSHTFGLVFPFGLLAIALRFLLRALLTLSGHFEADPDEAHKEEIGAGKAEAKGGA